METLDKKLDSDTQSTKTVEQSNADIKSRYDNIKEALEILYKEFPKAFIKEGDAKPLKLGIFDDIKNRVPNIEGLTITKVRAALRAYTSRLKYYYALKNNTMRIDLDGNEVEPVSKEHLDFAISKIEEANQKKKANKALYKDKKDFKNKKDFKDNKDRVDFKKKSKFNNKGKAFNGVNKNLPKTIDATDDNIEVGMQVLVSSSNHFVKGVIAEKGLKGQAMVTLNSGITVQMPLSRIKLEEKN